MIIGDEDDCSDKDPSVFSPTDTAKGPINFRCAEYGVTCDEPAPNMYWLAAGPMTAIDRTLLRRMGSTPLLRRSTAPPSSARRATARSAALRS